MVYSYKAENVDRLARKVITAIGASAPSVTCRAKRARDLEGISASRVRKAGNWPPVSVIRSVRKDSSSLTTVVRSVTTIAARAKAKDR